MRIQNKTYLILRKIQKILRESGKDGLTKTEILEQTKSKVSTVNFLINRGLLKTTGEKIQSISESGTGRLSKKKSYFLTVEAQELLQKFEKSSPLKDHEEITNEDEEVESISA